MTDSRIKRSSFPCLECNSDNFISIDQYGEALSSEIDNRCHKCNIPLFPIGMTREAYSKVKAQCSAV